MRERGRERGREGERRAFTPFWIHSAHSVQCLLVLAHGVGGPLPHGDVVSPEGDRPVQLLPQPQQGPGEPLTLGSHVATPLRACWRRPIKRPERITPAFNQASIAWRPAAKRGSSPKDTRTFPSASCVCLCVCVCVCVCVCEREREREREKEKEKRRMRPAANTLAPEAPHIFLSTTLLLTYLQPWWGRLDQGQPAVQSRGCVCLGACL